MNNDHIIIIGLIAGTLTTISLLPQVIKTIKIKETKDISTLMYLILMSGMLLWTTYGILIHSIPIILANAFSFILAAVMVFLKIKYG